MFTLKKCLFKSNTYIFRYKGLSKYKLFGKFIEESDIISDLLGYYINLRDLTMARDIFGWKVIFKTGSKLPTSKSSI